MNIFLNGTHVRSRVNLVHFKGVQLDSYETYMVKLTCCTWDCLLEHGAHSRHMTQIGIYFILRNNWHIDVPWNISKIFYWISFFFCSTHGSILNCMIFCIIYYANCTYCEWCTWLAHTLCKGLIWNYNFHLGSCKRFDEVGNVLGNFFTDTGFCSEILKPALFPSFGKMY